MNPTPLNPQTNGVLVPTVSPYALAVATELNDDSALRVEVVISTRDTAALEGAQDMGGAVKDPGAKTLGVRLDRAGILSLHHHLDVALAHCDIDPLPLSPDAAGVVPRDRQAWTGFDHEDDGTLPLESAVFQALGAASMCWEKPDAGGVFQSTRAWVIGDALMRLISTRLTEAQARARDNGYEDGRLAGYDACYRTLRASAPGDVPPHAPPARADDDDPAADEPTGARLTAAEFWTDPEPNRAVPDVQPLSADEVAGHRRDAVDAIVNGHGPRGYHVAVLELVATVEAQARARAEEAVHDHYEGPGRMRLSRTEDTDELVIGTEVDGRVTDVYVPTHEAAQLGGLLLRCVARDLALAGVRRLLRVTEDVDVRLTQRRRAREGAR